jgi:hypothetical protein
LEIIFEMIKGYSTWLALMLVACQTQKPAEVNTVNNTPFAVGIVQALITDETLDEASGLAASIANPGYLWTHNDSGDEARILLIDTKGILKATVRIAHAKNRDWEDMAIGPGPEAGKNYLYLGDIGDNEAEHPIKYIYRIEEPVIDLAKTSDTTIQQVDVIKFEYPDGMRDAESLLLDPLTRDLFVISKRELRCNVYRLPYPQSTHELVTAELTIDKIEFEPANSGDTIKTDDGILIKGYHPKFYYQIVGADISLSGEEVLVKSYSSVYYWKRQPNETIANVLQRPPTLLPYLPEPQGEAITFSHTGDGYYTINERMRGKEQTLIFYKRLETSQP